MKTQLLFKKTKGQKEGKVASNRQKSKGTIFQIIFLSLFLSFSSVSAFDFPSDSVSITTYTGNLTNLSELQDVNIPSPSNSEVLQYSSATNKWIAAVIPGFIDTNASTACTGTDYLAGNGSCLSITAGSGDITSVNTNGPYLSGGATSGDVNLLLNETYLNISIDARSASSGDSNYSNYSNVSYYWDNLDTYNTTQFENDGGQLHIISSWLTSFFNSIFSTKTTDDLTEGSTNLYDNSSWNESHANDLYLRLDTSNDPLTGNLDFGTNNITNTSCIILSNGEPMCWNADAYTLDIPTGLGNTIQVGQERTLIRRNLAGETIYVGQLVYDLGSSGEMTTIDLADSSNGSKIYHVGMVTIESCNNNAACPITYSGEVNDLNTSQYSEGTILYLSDDGSGEVTDIIPSGNSYHIKIGIVTRSHGTNGIIDFLSELDQSDEPVFNNFKVLGNQTINNNLTVNGYIEGQPLNGALDSGIIWAEEIDSYGNLNTTIVSGLNVRYPSFTVRLAKTSGEITICNITGDTTAVTDDQQSIFYVDSNCNIGSTSVATYITTDFSPGGITDFMSVVAHTGQAYKPVGVEIQNKRNIKDKKITFKTVNLDVVDGFQFYEETFPNYAIDSGEYIYSRDVLPTSLQNLSSTDTTELMYHSGGVWEETSISILNVTSCDDGTNLVSCSNPTNYRRYFIFMFGNDDGTDSTELHQLAGNNDIYYSNLAACLDTQTNPLTYQIPSYYQYSLVPLYAYCARATDTDWTGSVIDLREVQSGQSTSTVDTSVFLNKDGSVELTANWDQGPFNLTNTSSWFLGNVNWGSIVGVPFDITDYFTKTEILNFNYWNDTYATFNKTYADTLYADISVTGDNSSWNQSLADTLYYNINNPFGFYNSTDFDINDYYLNTNPSNYWNDTYATFNKTYADTLYASISVDGTLTSVSAGNGMDFTTITDTGSVTLGTPSTLTSSTTNAVTTTSHTHEIDESGFSIGASQVTTGTFGTGNYVMDTNLTVEKVVFENSASHFMEDNSTCVKIYGSTSILEIC